MLELGKRSNAPPKSQFKALKADGNHPSPPAFRAIWNRKFLKVGQFPQVGIVWWEGYSVPQFVLIAI